MCLFNDAELNCVSTYIRSMPECRQFEIGISTRRYLPAIGTAGFERVAVNGDNRLPWPPPSTMQITFEFILLDLSFCKDRYIRLPNGPMKNRGTSLSYVKIAGVLCFRKVLKPGLLNDKCLQCSLG